MKTLPFVAFVGLLVSSIVSATAADSSKPNVLFLFADDMSFEAIGALGLTDIETPNLDRLAKRGTIFTHAYNMGSWSGAVCVASRTMLVSGRTLWRANAIYNTTDQEREAGRLWPQMMSSAGYDTYFTGKWHIKTNPEQVFDTAKNIRAGMPKDTPQAYNRPLTDKADVWSPSDPSFGGFWEGGKHWSEVVADDAVGYLSSAKSKKNPFFMYIAFNAPHDPRQSPQEFVNKYPLERVQVPTNYIPLYPHKDAIGCGPTLRDEKLGPFPRTEKAVKVHRQEYYALITHLDVQIGRILDELESSGQADNTYIFFTADHGLAVGHHGLFGKQNMYDHSLRVPFIVAGPDVKPNERNETAVYLQDVMATALDVAGAKIPEHVEFQSVLPLLHGNASADKRDAIYGGYLELQRAIIHDGWKLILYPKTSVSRLYHLVEDPSEMNDLADSPAQATKKQDLFKRLLALQNELEDPLDLSKAFPTL